MLVAFGDIYGFRAWIRRGLTTPEESKNLIEQVYEKFEEYALGSNCYVKFLGDGIMIVREIRDQKHNGDVAVTRNFLMDVHELTVNILSIIKNHFPRPDGFRLRVATGYVWKRIVSKVMKGKIVKCPEYIGYAINLTHCLLEVAPSQSCVFHESIKEIFGNKKTGIKYERLVDPKEKPRGIDPEDIAGLWTFGPEEKTNGSL